MSEPSFPIITVGDLAATCGFYEQLGFVETYRFPPEGEPTFVTMERGPSAIGIGSASDGNEDEGFAYWVYVPDLDSAVEALRKQGATVVAEPEDQPWGERVARVRDPAGNLVLLGAAL